jgi:DNA helicase-4
LRDAARSIHRETRGRAATVLLRGRTKYDERIVEESSLFVRKDGAYAIPQAPDLSFRFLTVHKAKGLEGDYVILLNAEDGQLGFPNRIADDPVLQLVLGVPEPYEFAEERRLFYVALTRTRNRVFILVPDEGRSPFIDDLRKCGVGNLGAGTTDGPEKKILCPKCGKGTLEKRKGPHGAFTGCSNYPQCDYTVPFLVDENTPRCPDCGGFLVKRSAKSSNVPFFGCTNFPHCRYTEPLKRTRPIVV